MEKVNRPRDAKGRFVKVEKPNNEISEKELTRIINRVADGDEPTLESVHEEYLMREFFIRCAVGVVSFILIVLAMWLFQGCTPQEKVVYVPSIKTVTVETVTHDTIIETRLVEYYTERQTPDTTSYLSNPYSFSQATVSGGVLNHTLGTHPGASVEQPVQIKEVIITEHDSIPYPVEVVHTEYVQRKLYGIERFLMGIGVIAILAFAFWLWKH